MEEDEEEGSEGLEDCVVLGVGCRVNDVL